MNLTLVVLAAGIGSRYGGLKQMDPVGPSGEFLLDYGVYDALKAGFTRVIFVIRREIEDDFENIMGARLKQQIPVTYVFQDSDHIPTSVDRPVAREKPLGTGHAVWVCRDLVDTPFAVINADDFYGRHSYETMADFLGKTADDPFAFGMVGFILRNTLSDYGAVARGICTAGEDGLLKHIVETTGIERSNGNISCPNRAFSGEELVSMNFWGLKPSFFQHAEDELMVFLGKYGNNPKAEFYVPSVIDKLIVDNLVSVRVLETGSLWFGMTNPRDRDVVTENIGDLIEQGVYPRNLWE